MASEQTVEKGPRELVPGDVFRVPSGPHAGWLMRVDAPPEPTKYGSYSVSCVPLNRVEVTIDYAAKLAVRSSGSGG